jgi:hypothetical protein
MKKECKIILKKFNSFDELKSDVDKVLVDPDLIALQTEFEEFIELLKKQLLIKGEN